jgi:hypothetical protein
MFSRDIRRPKFTPDKTTGKFTACAVYVDKLASSLKMAKNFAVGTCHSNKETKILCNKRVITIV